MHPEYANAINSRVNPNLVHPLFIIKDMQGMQQSWKIVPQVKGLRAVAINMSDKLILIREEL